MGKTNINKRQKRCIPRSDKKKCNICDGNKYYVSYDGYYNPCSRCNPNGKVH